jgi:TonB-linked SusC/RagA family outer membrane protein
MKEKLKCIGILTFLLIFCGSFSLFSQDKSISGFIKSESGESLPGATILVKGTTIGTISNSDGNYSIKVPADKNTLVFSFVGYQLQEVKINGKAIINAILLDESLSISEVAVIGYGTQKRKDLTGAVSTISSEQLSKVPVSSMDQALQGLSSGVAVTSNSGDPGGGVSLNIRGVGTINNTDPLYVIDGVPIVNNSRSEITTAGGSGKTSNPLANINSNDIESINILKDASAAAIYGVRGANGVVVITTKKGKQGKPTVSFESTLSVENIGKKLDLLKARDYADLMIEMYKNAGTPLVKDGDGPYNVLDPSYVVDRSNWQDAFFKTGIVQNYYLRISGGSEKVDYNFSGGYYKNTSTSVGSGMDRYSLQSNSNYHLGKITIGESISLSRVKNRRSSFLSARSPIRILFEMAPTVPVYNPNNDGGYGGPGDGDGFSRWNPVGLAELTQHYIYRNRVIGSTYAEWEIFKGLKYKLNLGADMVLSNGDNFVPSYFFSTGQQTKYASLKEYSSTEMSPLVENTVNYSRKFKDHNLTVLLGYTQQSYEFKQISAFSNALQSNDKQTLNTARPDGQISVTGIKDEWAIRSLIGRLMYSFKDKYLLTASFRRDGSSRFAPSNRWGTFPSFAVGWRLSDEKFMKDINFISNLKLRAGYGKIGNQEVPAYGFESTLITTAYYPFGGTAKTGATQTSLANKNLHWEVTDQSNIGIDASFFKGRLEFVGDYYIKNTKDIIVQAPVPGTTGIKAGNAPYINSGDIQNRGLELSLTYRENKGDFKYEISANGSFLKNEVTSLGIGNPIVGRFPDDGGAVVTTTEKGYAINSFLGYITDGIFQTQAEIDSHAKQPFAQPGDIRFKDLNNDKVIDDKDRTILGNPIPKFSYGISLSASYKSFDLSVLFQGIEGVKIYNGLRYWTEGMAEVYNADANVLTRWTGPGTSNSMPRAVLNDPNMNRRPSDRFIEDGSYLRMKNITLGYKIPETKLKSITRNSISNVRFFITCQNLFTFTKYTGYDPEIGVGFNQGTGVANQGVDYGIIPQAKTALVGINVSF